MSANIFNHNKIPLKLQLNQDRYWDFYLSNSDVLYYEDGLTERCLSAYIDFNDPDCVWFDEIKSKARYVWEGSKGNSIILKNIGTTAVDNGFYHYDKTRITNAIFYEIFLNSVFEVNGDKRLTLNKVNGNNAIYNYPIDLVQEGDIMVSKANGGFYQGFFNIAGKDYQVLPLHIGHGFDFEITLKKSDFEYNDDKPRLNDIYPENKGIFFYIGTRSENKWWKYYDVDSDIRKKDIWYFDSEYIKDEFYNNADYENNVFYIDQTPIKTVEDQVYFAIDGYFKSDCKLKCGESYLEPGYLTNGYQTDDNTTLYNKDGYVAKDEYIDEDSFEFLTKDGYNFKNVNDTIDYHTDNKFLFFDQTKNGFTTKTWDEDMDITVTVPKIPDVGNYFLLFNQTKSGYRTSNIDRLTDKKKNKYNIFNDIYRNAFAMQITDDGKVGFKYAIKDCEKDYDAIEILSEFTDSGIITDNEWHTIHVKLLPIKSKYKNFSQNCSVNSTSDDTMKVIIYVDGILALISKEIPILKLRELNDHSEKQEGVPYNISIGGGTQGLCDVIYLNYRKYPEYILPLEENFAGSFIGYIKDFKFYSCPLEFQEIKNNFNYINGILKGGELFM